LLRGQAHTEISDRDLIKLYLDTQNHTYFSLLYNKYAGKVFGKCLSILKEEDLARDAMQDVFMKILLNLSSFEEKSMFSTWVYSITYNYCIDQVRKKKKDKVLFSEDIERSPDVPEEDIPDEYLMEMEVHYLKKVLSMLGEEDRLILLMKYQDDMSIKEIAESIKKTESAVKMKIKRAKHKAVDLYKELSKND
jgi:RNA polymerase sigma factor (sigma-70 family)